MYYFDRSLENIGKTNQAVIAPSELETKSHISPLRRPPVQVS